MDLQSYIQLKEACSLASHSQNLSESVDESVDSIWEEVEAFAHALVEEEGVDLSDMTWDEVREAYLDEQGGNNAMRLRLQKNRENVKAAQPKPAPAASSSFSARRSARRSASPAAQANTNSSGQNIKTTKPAPTAKPAPAKATPTAKPQPQAARPQPQAAPPKAKPAPAKSTINDLKSRMPKPVKPSGASAGASAIGAATAKARPTATAIKSNRLRAALDSARKPAPMKEETDFDLVLEHLIDSGFGPDEALTFMVNMTEEKREEILENRRAARAAGGYKDDSKKQTDPSKDGFTGISGSIKDVMKQSAAMDKKKTRKEEDESLYQAYLSMMSEEGCDARKDKEQERKGTDARTDYSKPPAAGNDFGKKKPMSDEERSAAMAKVVANLKKKGGK